MNVDDVRVYVAVRGSTLTDADAERIGSYLDDKVGDRLLTPAGMVDLARPVRSPIHQDFEWRDAVAAEKYRVEQAKHLLRSILVEVEIDGVGSTRAFHPVVVIGGDGADTGYVPSHVVWRNADFAAQVIARAVAELEAWERKYAEYEQLGQAVSRVAEIVTVIRQQV